MTSLAISSVKTMISPQMEPARTMPICLRVAKYLSVAAAMSAVATTIYGIVVNLIPFIALGSIFLLTSFTNFYLIHQISNLKTIEEDSIEIKALNKSLGEKNDQIKELTGQIRAVSDQLTAQTKEYAKLSAADAAAQKASNEQLQRSAELLAKTERDTQKKFDQLRSSTDDQIRALQKQSEADQKTIADLNQTAAKINDQNAALQTTLGSLQKQVNSYQEQIQTYSRLNTQLEEQLKTIFQAAKTPDMSSINAQSAAIDEALAKNKAAAGKTAKTVEQINAMLDALNKKNPTKPIVTAGK